MLIVCEGTKTEPSYFSDIRREYRLPTAHIVIVPSAAGTEPRQIVDYAEDEFSKTRSFDRVYAVFDRDQHTTYVDAVTRSAQLDGRIKNDEKRPVSFEAIVSVPCFELWLLLHYDDVLAYFHRNEIQRRLKVHIPRYDKGMKRIYEITKANVSIAAGRGARLKQRFSRLPGTEPYTDVQELVGRLKTLWDSKVAK